jgi:hypothetical protein
MKISIKLFPVVFAFCVLGSCTTVKPYERVYVDDAAMQMGVSSGEVFEYYVESIREGGISAGSGKSGGGCGCN